MFVNGGMTVSDFVIVNTTWEIFLFKQETLEKKFKDQNTVMISQHQNTVILVKLDD